MAFPVSPTEGQTYTENNTVWIYSAVTGQWNRSVINPLNETLYVFGSASATGAAGEIQYTDGSRLAASPNLVWDDVNDELEVGGDVVLDDGGTFTTTLQTVTPTQNRTISFPDATGTVALVAGSSGQLVYNNAGAYAGVPSTVVGATGDVTLALNGAASTPPLDVTGTWFTGGTSTTTKPQVLIEPAGTTSTAWSTSGTGLGVNAASGFTGRLLDLQTNGTSRAIVTGGGQLLAGTSTARGVGSSVLWQSYIEGNSGSGIYPGLAIVDNSTGNEGPYFILGKSKSATVGSSTVVAINDSLGGIVFAGADGTNLHAQGARISCFVDGTPGTGDMPGRLVFSTTADGAGLPTERMRIRNDGNVYINTTSDPSVDQAKLGVVSTSAAFPAVSIVGGTGPWAVKVGTTDTGATRYIIGVCNNSGTTLGGITTNGTVITYGGTSDYRLKENVKPVTNALDTLANLKPVTFTWKSTGEVGNGFIAHELAEAFPDAVAGQKDAVEADGSIKPQMVDQSKLVSVLTAALQEAVAKIEILEAKVAALEGA
jgi:hypothetical protein